MVRSVNIEKTNQLLWSLIKITLREIRDQSPSYNDLETTEDHILYDRDGLLGDEISWMTAEQLELLNDDGRKNVINKMISSTTVHFDEKSKKHTLHVTFSEATQRVINAIRETKSSSANNGNQTNETSESSCEVRIRDQRDVIEESTEALQTSPDDLVRLFGDGGVGDEGPLPQRFAGSLQNTPCVHIGPVILSVRPLSEYQESLITTILRLRSEGWLDHQIAKHFNESGYLTPRGCSWVPQSVFSIRRKYQRRLGRLGEGEG
jgi:hypothetical protein